MMYRISKAPSAALQSPLPSRGSKTAHRASQKRSGALPISHLNDTLVDFGESLHLAAGPPFITTVSFAHDDAPMELGVKIVQTLVSKLIAEFLGTFVIVLVGCGAVAVGDRMPGVISQGAIPIVFGLTVAAMIYAVGHISGAHFNPAVTIAFWSARHFPGRQVFGYAAAQILGGLVAIGCLFILLPAGKSFGATVPTVGVWRAFGWEFLFSFLLMFVIIAVATDTRAVGTMAGAAIGATVTVAAYVGGPLTGASMNPARSLAPAVAEGKLDLFWIYALAPVAGALVAAKIYEWIRCNSTEPNNAGGCC